MKAKKAEETALKKAAVAATADIKAQKAKNKLNASKKDEDESSEK